MTNLLKSFKGQDNIIYPARDDDDAESSRKWENLLANFKDEGEKLIFNSYLDNAYCIFC